MADTSWNVHGALPRHGARGPDALLTYVPVSAARDASDRRRTGQEQRQCEVVLRQQSPWLCVIGTTARTQVEQWICQHLRAIRPLLERCKASLPLLARVFPGTGSCDTPPQRLEALWQKR
jgi:hypothetical protein